jgi:uncharacterized protein (TIGR04255 family)
MTFPNSPRVVYKQNPLVEVICQLKFPPILRIDTEPPAAFQERIRKDYPLLQENVSDQQPLPPGIAKLIGQSIPGFFQGQAYTFLSEDQSSKVVLTREFIAVSTGHYTRWEEFRSRLQTAVEAVRLIYEPNFYVRIGLRYRDVIRKSVRGLEHVDWAKLLRPHILGELGSPKLSSSIQHATRDVLISLDEDKGQVRVLHGLIREEKEKRLSYSIDSDFFYEGRTELKDAFSHLDSFNREAGRLFRWCITPLLHKYLGATKLR